MLPVQVLLVIPASVLQTALAAASEQLGQQQANLTDLLLTDPGALMSMSYMSGPNGAADSWAARLNLDPEVGAVVAGLGWGGGLMSMSYMSGPNGAADSWAARSNLDAEVT